MLGQWITFFRPSDHSILSLRPGRIQLAFYYYPLFTTPLHVYKYPHQTLDIYSPYPEFQHLCIIPNIPNIPDIPSKFRVISKLHACQLSSNQRKFASIVNARAPLTNLNKHRDNTKTTSRVSIPLSSKK
jgi:hypothetical protein